VVLPHVSRRRQVYRVHRSTLDRLLNSTLTS
jgi:hypothetical protein